MKDMREEKMMWLDEKQFQGSFICQGGFTIFNHLSCVQWFWWVLPSAIGLGHNDDYDKDKMFHKVI